MEVEDGAARQRHGSQRRRCRSSQPAPQTNQMTRRPATTCCGASPTPPRTRSDATSEPASPTASPPLRRSCRSFRASPESVTGRRPTPAPWFSIFKTRCSTKRTASPAPTASISICAIRSSPPTSSANRLKSATHFVSRIRMAQPVAGMTRVVLETKANSTFSVSLEPNPYRLVVEVRKIGATPKGAVNLFPNAAEAEKNKLAIVVPPPTKEDLQLRARVPKMRIVVDAGHGGWDLGTVGRRGLLEKDLVLEIAQRLGKLLESRLGMEVIYTRQDDNYIPLDERASDRQPVAGGPVHLRARQLQRPAIGPRRGNLFHELLLGARIQRSWLQRCRRSLSSQPA